MGPFWRNQKKWHNSPFNKFNSWLFWYSACLIHVFSMGQKPFEDDITEKISVTELICCCNSWVKYVKNISYIFDTLGNAIIFWVSHSNISPIPWYTYHFHLTLSPVNHSYTWYVNKIIMPFQLLCANLDIKNASILKRILIFRNTMRLLHHYQKS